MKQGLFISLLMIGCNCFNPNDYISIPHLKFPNSLATNILEIDSWFDYIMTTLYIGVFYYALYFGLCQLLVRTHPATKNSTLKRAQQTNEERRRGIKALLGVIISTTLIIWKVWPHNQYYQYYETHEFGIKEFLISLAIYMITFDVWFYSTHIIGHTPFFWKHLHGEHHDFVEPTAYAQDAVHPIEALIQGPIGHFLPTLFYPYHPVCHHLFGLLTSIYAQVVHDGRWDPAGHTIHHYYYSCNYSIWGFCDYIFGTKYNPKKYPIKYIPTWLRNQEKKIE